MAQILVRNLETEVKTRLQRRARRNGRSMEEEVREILRDATKQEDKNRKGLGTRIAARFKASASRTARTSRNSAGSVSKFRISTNDHPRHQCSF